MKTLLYLSYGTGAHEREVVYSILTAQKWAKAEPQYRVLILTDHPASFSDVAAEIIFIPSSQWAEWSGSANFAHRRKILAMQHVMRKSDGAVVLLDGDTWLRAPAERLFDRVAPGRAVMHIREGAISEIDSPLMRRLTGLLENHAFSVDGKPCMRIPAESQMWNAGVIGLDSADAALLDDVLMLTDELCKVSNLHVLEQFAFSWVLMNKLQLAEAADLVFHYWPPYLHDPFRSRIDQIFASGSRLTGVRRLEYFYSCRPRPTAGRRLKVVLKRCGQLLGVLKGYCRSNEW